ncbi:MAG: (Fe-S)-binding protein [Dehalococcoidia bacterium]|nr:MAG: (Fe-S)-binding protein [Dehalococcoidia bacterium]
MWDASKCDLCGDCLVKCQYVDYDKSTAASDIKLLMFGKDADILHKCVTCCACSEYCPTGADPFDLMLKMMEKTHAFPISPEGVNIFSLAPTIPAAVTAGDPDKPVLSLCVMQLPEGTVDGQMFKGMPIARGGDYFCYVGYMHAGMESPLAQNAKKFIDNLAAIGRDIVFLHDDCYAMVDAKVKDYGIKVPFKYMHILEFMRNYLRDNRSKITRLNQKVAYQRPCASRLTPDKDKYVDEIFELIGVQRPARKYERESALCCTAAFVRVYPQLAAGVQAKNIDDAIQAGADALVTLCPMCDRVLKKPTSEKGLRKIFITDLCRMALGEKLFPD